MPRASDGKTRPQPNPPLGYDPPAARPPTPQVVIDDSEWGSLSNLVQRGVQFAIAKTRWPVDVAVQLSGGTDTESELVPGAALFLPWAQAGLLFGSDSGLSFGIDARYSHAEIRIAGADADAGGPQYALTLGWGR